MNQTTNTAATTLEQVNAMPAATWGWLKMNQTKLELSDELAAAPTEAVKVEGLDEQFRGAADAGERVGDSEDPRTGIPIRSLYDGGSGRPSGETMRTFDVLVVDMQDVGLRFYTYHITMLRMMDACAAAGRRV